MIRKVRTRVYVIKAPAPIGDTNIASLAEVKAMTEYLDLNHAEQLLSVIPERKDSGWLVLHSDHQVDINTPKREYSFILTTQEIYLGKVKVRSDMAGRLIEYYQRNRGSFLNVGGAVMRQRFKQ